MPPLLRKRLSEAIEAGGANYTVDLLRSAQKLPVKPGAPGAPGRALSLEVSTRQLRLLQGKKCLWKSGYAAHAQVVLPPSRLAAEFALKFAGQEVLALRVVDADTRDSLLLLLREFMLRFCEQKDIRWAGDTRAAMQLRTMLAATSADALPSRSRRDTVSAIARGRLGTAALPVPFAGNLASSRGRS